ncbi:MAG: methylated-DNA--[protein]-cysteine S-methyltransferase [Planctomycetota bacterium]
MNIQHYHSPIGGLRLKMRRRRLLKVELRDILPEREVAGTACQHLLTRHLETYFGGRPMPSVWEQLELGSLNEFTRAVLFQLNRIEFNHTVSYGELAERAGYPGAARAAGNALNTNPFPIFLPCHRVIRADGTPGGFGWGEDIKIWLLSHEQSSAGNNRVRMPEHKKGQTT